MIIGKVIRDIAYSFGANAVSLGISVFMVMVVPKFLSVDDYGLWQLYLFYFSYLGFLHFGWEDGIYLRYAGKQLEELDRRRFAGQFYGIIVLQVVLALLVTSVGGAVVDSPEKRTALLCAVGLAPFVNFNNLCDYILQITGQIKVYAKRMIAARLLYFFGVLLFLVALGLREFPYMYYAHAFSAIGVTLLGVYFFRSFLQLHFEPLREIISEAKENLWVGIKLMFANIASILIMGSIRYGISIGWDVAIFGRVSLTLGISNFLMIFINSVSVVFFPIVKRMDESRRAETYMRIRNMLTFLLFGGLLCYYPMKSILSWWLPKYADSLVYMSVLFPVCVFESKVSLLINTYLKSMRQEALMLRINVCSVLFSLVVTGLTVVVFHDLNLTVFSIVAVYAFRCIVAECATGRLLGLDLTKAILIDVGMCAIFISTGWLMDSWLCLAFYGLAYGVFLLTQRAGLHELVALLKRAGER